VPAGSRRYQSVSLERTKRKKDLGKLCWWIDAVLSGNVRLRHLQREKLADVEGRVVKCGWEYLARPEQALFALDG
jgi:hypothetical protein